MTDESIPQRLASAFEGRYQLVRELGHGGMATVYLANDLKHDRQVAIKVLKPELAAVIGGERFVAEIKTTAGLQHPHILPLFDSGEADSFLFYVMPYIEGETLRDRLDRERQLGVEEALRITRDVADALDYAHRQGVIHRDIKPENILLHDGRPVVADFGIAVAISAAGGGRMTETGLSLGTPHYMSPEQATADRDLTVRSDVYSLACVLYEMLAGDPPHTGPTAQAILVRILTESPRPVDAARASVPPHIAAVLAKGLEKLPADRFDSAAEFRAALDRTDFTYTSVLRGAGTTTGPPRKAGARISPARRSGPLVPVLAGATVLLAIAALFGWLRPATSGTAPQSYTLDARGWDLSTRERVEVSPDGRTFVAVGSPAGVSGGIDILVRRAGELDFRPLAVGGEPRYPRFSPDGERIVFADWGQGSIRVTPAAGGTPATRYQEDGLEAFDLAWADDGFIYFWAGGQIRRIPEAGGPYETMLADANWAFDPLPLPGGRGVLLTDSRSDPVSVALYEFGADSARTLVPEAVKAHVVASGYLVYGHPDGGLQAVPFDSDRLEVTGAPTPVRDGVSVEGSRAWFSVSSGGTLVYVEGRTEGWYQDATLVERDLTTGDETEVPLPPRPIVGVAYAPDGDRVAIGAAEPGGEIDESNLVTFDLRSTAAPRAWPFEDEGTGPAWSPSGDRIVYEAYDKQTSWVMLQDVTSEAPPTRVTTGEGAGANAYDATWASDSLLVYVRDDVGSSSTALWAAGLSEGTAPREYLASGYRMTVPDVSPDGTRVAYVVGGKYDVAEVEVTTFPDPGVPVRASVGGATAVRWHSDGSSLFYSWVEGSRGLLTQAFVSSDPVFTVDSTRTVLDITYDRVIGAWDIHPTGDRVILVRSAENGSEEDGGTATGERYIVVLNWLEEMEGRLRR